MNNKSLIKKLVEAFDFGKLKPKNQTVNQVTMKLSLLRMYEYNQELVKTVDLGLPSGTLWCKFNVGAKNESETEYGDYFAWGETDQKNNYSWKNYKFCVKNNFTKYNEDDNLTLLLPEDDAATVNMGKHWRMPTKAQYQELINETDNVWVENYKDSGVNGRLFISKNGNALFFPAAGYKLGSSLNFLGSYCGIWSSALSSCHVFSAYELYFGSGDTYLDDGGRSYGCVVRGVFE